MLFLLKNGIIQLVYKFMFSYNTVKNVYIHVISSNRLIMCRVHVYCPKHILQVSDMSNDTKTWISSEFFNWFWVWMKKHLRFNLQISFIYLMCDYDFPVVEVFGCIISIFVYRHKKIKKKKKKQKYNIFLFRLTIK